MASQSLAWQTTVNDATITKWEETMKALMRRLAVGAAAGVRLTSVYATREEE
jgi:hypothetical protein